MEKDFGAHYVEFYPSANGSSTVIIDGSFTAQQLRNIADELDRLEAKGKAESFTPFVPREVSDEDFYANRNS